MFLYLIKILLCFFAINYSFALLKDIHSLKRYPFLHALCFICLTILLITHHNFFSPILEFSNFQNLSGYWRIIKFTCCIVLIRIPVVFLCWLLIDTINLNIGKEDAVKLSRAGWYPIRKANRITVTNGIATFKPSKRNLMLALMLLLLCGNFINQHLLICAGIFLAFYLYKNSLRILNFSKKIMPR
jgi:hypothetical protein